MTIRQATSKMLNFIISHESNRVWQENGSRIRDKDIAKELQISPVTFSRLRTKVQNPDIQTWARICKRFKELAPQEEFMKIINEVE